VQVQFDGGVRVTLLRSNVTLHNRAAHSVVVALGAGVPERVVLPGEKVAARS
jgi:hypothetical protein